MGVEEDGNGTGVETCLNEHVTTQEVETYVKMPQATPVEEQPTPILSNDFGHFVGNVPRVNQSNVASSSNARTILK